MLVWKTCNLNFTSLLLYADYHDNKFHIRIIVHAIEVLLSVEVVNDLEYIFSVLVETEVA